MSDAKAIKQVFVRNLSYDTTVSYLEEKINMILEHLDLND